VHDPQLLAQAFEHSRSHLQAVAFRMLGSLSEAEDAVQEAWLRLSRSDTAAVENLGGFLTTVVARICLDMLRSRKARGEHVRRREAAPDAIERRAAGPDPEHEVALADAVGLALLVVLELLDPAERLAFVLHDMFGLPFEEIAGIVGRSPDAARQLASRARRRVHGSPSVPPGQLDQQREVISAFLRALRTGDLEALVAVLDPEVVVCADAVSAAKGAATEVRGARNWAKQAAGYKRGARFLQPALVDGAVGLVLAPRGHLSRVIRFTLAGDKIARIDVIGEPTTLGQVELAVLP
jgi:RNA polymerase sigma-70 factor (ECF subfamily)